MESKLAFFDFEYQNMYKMDTVQNGYTKWVYILYIHNCTILYLFWIHETHFVPILYKMQCNFVHTKLHKSVAGLPMFLYMACVSGTIAILRNKATALDFEHDSLINK